MLVVIRYIYEQNVDQMIWPDNKVRLMMTLELEKRYETLQFSYKHLTALSRFQSWSLFVLQMSHELEIPQWNTESRFKLLESGCFLGCHTAILVDDRFLQAFSEKSMDTLFLRGSAVDLSGKNQKGYIQACSYLEACKIELTGSPSRQFFRKIAASLDKKVFFNTDPDK